MKKQKKQNFKLRQKFPRTYIYFIALVVVIIGLTAYIGLTQVVPFSLNYPLETLSTEILQSPSENIVQFETEITNTGDETIYIRKASLGLSECKEFIANKGEEIKVEPGDTFQFKTQCTAEGINEQVIRENGELTITYSNSAGGLQTISSTGTGDSPQGGEPSTSSGSSGSPTTSSDPSTTQAGEPTTITPIGPVGAAGDPTLPSPSLVNVNGLTNNFHVSSLITIEAFTFTGTNCKHSIEQDLGYSEIPSGNTCNVDSTQIICNLEYPQDKEISVHISCFDSINQELNDNTNNLDILNIIVDNTAPKIEDIQPPSGFTTTLNINQIIANVKTNEPATVTVINGPTCTTIDGIRHDCQLDVEKGQNDFILTSWDDAEPPNFAGEEYVSYELISSETEETEQSTTTSSDGSSGSSGNDEVTKSPTKTKTETITEDTSPPSEEDSGDGEITGKATSASIIMTESDRSFIDKAMNWLKGIFSVAILLKILLPQN